jgi:hypothetical protein
MQEQKYACWGLYTHIIHTTYTPNTSVLSGDIYTHPVSLCNASDRDIYTHPVSLFNESDGDI